MAALAVAGGVIGIRLASGESDHDAAPSNPVGATGDTVTAPRTIPDFVWVSAANATRYRVEFVRDGSVVLEKTTAVPRLHVPAATLPPGRYRWRVWALGANGEPVGAALVDAAVDIA